MAGNNIIKKKTGGRRAPHANPVKLVEPGVDDILCGKDRACALHKGSQRFRAVIDTYRATYQKACTKVSGKLLSTWKERAVLIFMVLYA